MVLFFEEVYKSVDSSSTNKPPIILMLEKEKLSPEKFIKNIIYE